MKKFYAFLLAVFPVTALLAQAPGGVGTNLGLWLRADANTHSTDSLNTWDYFNNPSNSFTAPAGSRPIVVNSSLNFQPTVLFKGAQLMDGPVGASAPITAGNDAYSVFGVWSSTIGPSSGVYQRVWSQRNNTSNNDGVSLWLYNGAFYGDQPEIGPTYIQSAVQPYNANAWYMSQLNLLAANTNDLEIIDQTNLTGTPSVASTDPTNNAIATRNLANAVNRLGASSDAAIAANDAEFFSGNTAEVIVYNGPVSGTARNRIFSYLSFKYGIHTGASLVASNGTTTFWDATTNSTYNNSVFGLGMDNGSGLNLTISNSINTGSGNGVGQSGKANITLSNPSSLSDQSFLVLGNDNGAVTESTPANVPTIAAGSKGLARTWKAQVTGTPGTVDLALDLNGITVSGTTASDFRLIVDNDGNGNFTDGQIGYYTPTSYTGGIAQFSAVTLSNNVVMGVLTKATPATPLPVTWLGFTANVAGADVDLNWQVAANESGKVYDVEHATDGVHFTTVGQVANIASVKSYSFVHTNAGAGVHYYRIHEIDVDGKSIYSKILSVAITATDFSVRVLNNPVVSQTDLEIEINAVNAGNASIEIWTAGGARLNALRQGVGAGSNRIRVPLGAQAAGTYILKVKLNEGTRTVQVLKF